MARSQKEENARHAVSLSSIAAMITGRERSGPTFLMSIVLSSAYAGHSSKVCVVRTVTVVAITFTFLSYAMQVVPKAPMS